MNKRLDISKILFIEAVIWFVLIAVIVFSIRIHNVKQYKAQKQYQIFISDVDGLIIGSPVKYMGVQVGCVSYIKLLKNDVYVKFVLNNPNVILPKGVVANVEFSGMAGTKSLELYPPTEQDLKTEKLLNIKDTFRLAHTVDLLDNMMSKLALIGGRFNYFMKQMSPFAQVEQNENFNGFIEHAQRINGNFKKVSKSKMD